MLSKLFSALERTRTSILHAFKNLSADKMSVDAIEGVEKQLLLADVGLGTVDSIIDILRKLSEFRESRTLRISKFENLESRTRIGVHVPYRRFPQSCAT